MRPTLKGLLEEVSGHPLESVRPYLVEFAKLLFAKIEGFMTDEELMEHAVEAWAAIESCYDVNEQVEAENANPGKVIQIRRATC